VVLSRPWKYARIQTIFEIIVDMSWLNRALEALEAHGHRVDTNPGVIVRGTEFLVPIDGRLRSESEIYDELAAPIDADTYVFEDCGAVRGKLRIAYEYGRVSYKLAADGIECETGVISDCAPEFVQRTAKALKATSFRRVENHLWNFGLLSAT
jgi:hypothetical protein